MNRLIYDWIWKCPIYLQTNSNCQSPTVHGESGWDGSLLKISLGAMLDVQISPRMLKKIRTKIEST
jgi:hypothetical protein